MSEELKKLEDAIMNAQADFQKKNDERLEKIEKTGQESAELKGVVTEMSADLSDLEAKYNELKSALGRAKKGESEVEDIKSKPEYKAAMQFIKGGERSLSVEQKKLISTNDPEAGYLIPENMGQMFDETIRELSPFRQVANVLSIGTGNQITLPINKKGGINAKWRAEKDPFQETGNPSVGQLVINAHLADGTALATQELLDDSGVNIEQWLSTEAGEDFVALENAAFFNGDGNGKPHGFLNYVGQAGIRGIEAVPSESNTGFTRDGIVKLRGSIKTAYLPGCVFMAQRSAITEIRLLKDDEGRYSLINDFSQGPGTTLLGHSLIEAPDMPAVAGGAYSLAFGNFSQGYQILDRQMVTLKRFDEIYNPFIGFTFTKRVGGDLKKAEAIKVQEITE